MHKLWPLREYTAELRRRLPARYFRPVPHRLWWLLPFAALAAGAVATVLLFDLPLVANLALALVAGHFYASMGFLGHEILHGTVVRRRWLRDLTGAVCFAPFSLGPLLWRRWHNVEHHGHTQQEDDDPDAMATLEDWRERPALRALYRLAPWLRSLLTFVSFTFWFSFHSFHMLLKFFPRLSVRERWIAGAQFLAPVAFWTGLLVLGGPFKFLFVYVVPVLVANFIVMSYIATNHLLNPLAEVNDPLVTSLTVRVPRWVDILHLNFSHHTEHHVFPGMNPKYAPAVKKLLQELWPDRYQDMPHWRALLALWRTPRLYRDHTSLIDPQRGLEYPTVGWGLDPRRIQGRRTV